MTSKEYYEKNKEKILKRNAEYRKRVKYHLKRDPVKQREYVKKSQKKHKTRVNNYRRNWYALNKINNYQPENFLEY